MTSTKLDIKLRNKEFKLFQLLKATPIKFYSAIRTYTNAQHLTETYSRAVA